jgi:hypothetical protein
LDGFVGRVTSVFEWKWRSEWEWEWD